MKKALLTALVALFLTVPAAAAENKTTDPQVRIDTTEGQIVVELYPDKAPQTVRNFLAYVDSQFYEGTIFHRVIPDFMIQGGGFTTTFKRKQTRDAIPNEAGNGLANERGTIAMARTQDPNSATAQFFINTKDNDFLNHRDRSPQGFGYAVFGRVVNGMEVVDRISFVRTTRIGSYSDVPVEQVVIRSIKRVK